MTLRKLPIDKDIVAAAVKKLKLDKHLGEMAKKHPDPIKSMRSKDPFDALIVAIMGQQISRAAAKAIGLRLAKLAGNPFTAQSLSKLTQKQLQSTGLSITKSVCVAACAQSALKDELSARSCKDLDGEQIIERLVAIKGIGLWSAQMVLIFGLGRPDVMPDGDGGIIRASSLLYKEEDRKLARAKLVKNSMKWAPYRTVAAIYLWATLA